MKKYLIILFVLFGGTIYGQTHAWDSSQGIIYPTSTTFKVPLSATDTVYGYDVLPSDSGNTYINRTSKVKLIYDFNRDATEDTIPAASLFQNYDLDSLVYTRIEDKILNADNSLNKPQRITELEVYTSASSSSIPVPNYVSYTLVDISGGGDETSIQAAIDNATAGDTILVKSGYYNETSALDLDLSVVIIGIGNVVSVAESSLLGCYLRGGAEVHNITFLSDATQYAYFCIGDDNKIINCNHEGFTDGYFFSNLDNDLLVSNSVFNAYNQPSYNHRFGTNAVFNECAFFGKYTDAVIFSGGYVNEYNTYDYCYFKLDYASTGKTALFSADPDSVMFNYCDIIIDTLPTAQSVVFGFSDAITCYMYFNSCKILVDTAIGTSSFYRFTSYRNIYTTHNNDSIIYNKGDGSFFSGEAKGLVFTGNYISSISGGVISLIDNDSTIIINNNDISARDPVYLSGTGIISVTSTNEVESNLYIKGNTIKNGSFFGNEDSHSSIYTGNYTNSYIEDNNIEGGGTFSIINKGDGISSVGNVSYNICKGGGIYVQGVDDLLVSNNTIYNTVGTGASLAVNDESGSGGDDNIFRNNLINTSTLAVQIFDTINCTGNIFSNNIYYDYTNFALLVDVSETFNEWQSRGYGQNSFNANPLLDANLCPQSGSPAIGGGFNLGSPYDYGYNCSDEYVQQRTPWTIGAKIVYKPSILINNSEVLIINGGGFNSILRF